MFNPNCYKSNYAVLNVGLRKRKFEQFVKGTKLKAASALPSKESDNRKKVLNSHSSSSALTFEYSYHGEKVNTITNITSADDKTKFSSVSKALSPLYDTDGSVNGPNLLSSENLTTPVVKNFNDLVHSPDSSSLEEPNQKVQQALGIINSDDVQKSVPVVDFIDSPQHFCSGYRDKNLKQIIRLVSNGGQPPRPVIPIGSKFQAEIPEWTGLVNRKNVYGGADDSKNLKWLGTRIWPMKGRSVETSVTAIGKGRLDSCSCVSPGSVDCIRSHILTKRLLLQFDIGLAFKSWKFDEMGEVVSKSWTSNEGRKFELLVKKNPLWRGANFWELALKHFPSKSKKSMLSYYFNVFIPRRMSQQTRSTPDEIDSDDDQADNDDDSIEE
ncbi:uncharacterized protein LOC142608780 [Castanea sativa]|uniref:uncharacterized protein LOC142608780 n=1 Tax=Castanea sativa TaxID=21020 RepID=UPI003F64AC5E